VVPVSAEPPLHPNPLRPRAPRPLHAPPARPQIELPLKHRAMFSKGLATRSGLLLYGPPGGPQLF